MTWLDEAARRCAQCGEEVRSVITGEVPKVAVQLTEYEATVIAIDVDHPEIRRRVLCALSLINPALATELAAAMDVPLRLSS
ncbi:MAG TPA: hypothetical protein VFD36_29445 [Kofleriaceae bacterium]|nr:hypothetical protein [Kofleriaceae bacterium]